MPNQELKIKVKALTEYFLEQFIDITEQSVNELEKEIAQCDTRRIPTTKTFFDRIEKESRRFSEEQLLRARNLRQRYILSLEKLQYCICQKK